MIKSVAQRFFWLAVWVLLFIAISVVRNFADETFVPTQSWAGHVDAVLGLDVPLGECLQAWLFVGHLRTFDRILLIIYFGYLCLPFFLAAWYALTKQEALRSYVGLIAAHAATVDAGWHYAHPPDRGT